MICDILGYAVVFCGVLVCLNIFGMVAYASLYFILKRLIWNISVDSVMLWFILML